MTKISMKRARKLYLRFQPFVMCASKMNPEICGVLIDDHVKNDITTPDDFDSLVDSFRYYNCGPETGKRVFFYENKKRA